MLAQLCGGSLWFAGNAVAADLHQSLGVPVGVAWLTSAVQLGFIAGTLLLAVSGLADRFESRTTFAGAALLGAGANLLTLGAGSAASVLATRVAVGLCLAGIYPIGMRAAAGWYARGLGRAGPGRPVRRSFGVLLDPFQVQAGVGQQLPAAGRLEQF